MRRFVIIALLAVVALGSCDPNGDAQVRFRNVTPDAELSYGIRFGEAEYIGKLVPSQVTGYYRVTPGDYWIEGLTSYGSWEIISYGTYNVAGGKKYAVVLAGSYYYGTLSVFLEQED